LTQPDPKRAATGIALFFDGIPGVAGGLIVVSGSHALLPLHRV
jgi:hypothetical protein